MMCHYVTDTKGFLKLDSQASNIATSKPADHISRKPKYKLLFIPPLSLQCLHPVITKQAISMMGAAMFVSAVCCVCLNRM